MNKIIEYIIIKSKIYNTKKYIHKYKNKENKTHLHLAVDSVGPLLAIHGLAPPLAEHGCRYPENLRRVALFHRE